MKSDTLATTRQREVLTWVHLLRIHQQVQKCEVAHLAKYNLTLPQFDVLAQLLREEGITQQTLADRLYVTKGNVCGLMDRMVEQGWVERAADPEDRRAHKIQLTPKGRQLIETVLPAHRQLLVSKIGRLSPTKVRQLQSLLSELDRSLRPDEGN
jgi:DNA-binding MarR family transcriptional regulator